MRDGSQFRFKDSKGESAARASFDRCTCFAPAAGAPSQSAFVVRLIPVTLNRVAEKKSQTRNSECMQQARDTVSEVVSPGASSEQAAKRQKCHHESGQLQASKDQSATLAP